MKTGLRI